MLMSACSSSHPPGSDAATYLAIDIVVPSREADGRVAGIDLDDTDSDGLDETSCVGRTPDSTSLTDPTERGVDNVVADLLAAGAISLDPRDTGPSPSELIVSGRLRFALRVTGVDSYEDDEHVLVQVGTARVPDCDDEIPETCRPQLDGSTPRAGQTMVFDPVGPSASVSISGGFLRGEVGDLDLPLAVVHTAAEYAERTITIRDTMIDVEIGPEELRGSLGGALLIEDLVEFAVMVDPSAPANEIRGAYSSFADLLQSASNPLECRALSIGMRLEAVHVGGT